MKKRTFNDKLECVAISALVVIAALMSGCATSTAETGTMGSGSFDDGKYDTALLDGPNRLVDITRLTNTPSGMAAIDEYAVKLVWTTQYSEIKNTFKDLYKQAEIKKSILNSAGGVFEGTAPWGENQQLNIDGRTQKQLSIGDKYNKSTDRYAQGEERWKQLTAGMGPLDVVDVMNWSGLDPIRGRERDRYVVELAKKGKVLNNWDRKHLGDADKRAALAWEIIGYAKAEAENLAKGRKETADVVDEVTTYRSLPFAMQGCASYMLKSIFVGDSWSKKRCESVIKAIPSVLAAYSGK